MKITVEIDEREREACDEMRRFLSLTSDEALLRAALYKLALWCEPDVDPALFRLHRPKKERTA